MRSDYIRNKITDKTILSLFAVLTFINAIVLTSLETIESTETIHSKTGTTTLATNETENNVGTSKSKDETLQKETQNVNEVTTRPTTTVVHKPTYTSEDVDLLARLIYAEAGCSWFSDYHQLAVATVVMNRVESNKFPNTIKDVIYDKGQYSCVLNGSIKKNPDSRTVANAKKVLEGYRALPSYVLYQSGEIQGKIYDSIYDKRLNITTYFCY